jgi:hypothetical protein
MACRTRTSGLGHLQVGADDPAASPADQVQVRAVDTQQLVAALVVAGIHRGHQVELLEQIQGAIYGGNVH